MKLLAYADGICHLRIYKQRFSTRPASVDVGSLSLGEPGDPDGFGAGHISMREAGFLEMQPVLMTTIPVTPERAGGLQDLEGERRWRVLIYRHGVDEGD